MASCDLIGQIKVNGTKKIPIIGIKKIPTLFSQNIKTGLQGDCERQLVHDGNNGARISLAVFQLKLFPLVPS